VRQAILSMALAAVAMAAAVPVRAQTPTAHLRILAKAHPPAAPDRAGVEPAPSTAPAAPILTTHPALFASIKRIARQSALWREAVDQVRLSGRRALVLTPDDVVVVDPETGAVSGRFDRTSLAEVAVVRRDGPEISVVVVVVNLPLLEMLHSRRGLSQAQRDADLDRIVVHEVYGHAVPYLLAGDASGRCPDPVGDDPAEEACSIQRENAVRAEMGLGHRRDYGLADLSLARLR
jgi:hypothetical protein